MRLLANESRAGRLRGKSAGWAVALTFERKGFARTLREEHQYTKLDSEKFWEDDKGWYVDPTSEIAQACDAAVKRYTPHESGEAFA